MAFTTGIIQDSGSRVQDDESDADDGGGRSVDNTDVGADDVGGDDPDGSGAGGSESD